MKKTSLFQGFLALMFVFVGPHMGCKDFFGNPYEAGLTPVATESETSTLAVETAAQVIPETEERAVLPTLYVEVQKEEGRPLFVCSGFIEEGYYLEVSVTGPDEMKVTVPARAFCTGDDYISVTPPEENDVNVTSMDLYLESSAYSMTWDTPLEVNYSVIENGVYSIKDRQVENLRHLALTVEP